MIQKFIESFDRRRNEIREGFLAKAPDSYEDIVRAVVQALADEDEYVYGSPDPKRIQMIDWGDYQGTLFFIIGASGYQPHHGWYVLVDYGSCSGCDTLEAIQGYSGDPVTENQANQYMTLAVHILQGLKEMS